MRSSLLVRGAVVTGAVAAAILVAGPASAHVTVNANGATQGGYTKVAFRVPNEKDAATTTKVEVNLPTDTPIASVSLRPMAGWTATTVKAKLPAPIKNDDGEITEAVNKITWTADAASAIRPGQFQEFEVSLGPLPKIEEVAFKTLQTYSDGETVRWIEVPAAGAEEPEHPAPMLKLAAATDTPAAAAAAPAAAPAAAAAEESDSDSGGSNSLGIVGILLGLAGLVAGLLAYRRAAQPS